MEIKVMNDTAQLISSLTEEEFALLNKFEENLIATDEEDNEIFRVEFNKGRTGAITKYGVTYNSISSNGKVMLTIARPGATEEDMKKLLKEDYCVAIAMVLEVEKEAIEYTLPNLKDAQAGVESLFTEPTKSKK